LHRYKQNDPLSDTLAATLWFTLYLIFIRNWHPIDSCS